jgi:hypothetical protein
MNVDPENLAEKRVMGSRRIVFINRMTRCPRRHISTFASV